MAHPLMPKATAVWLIDNTMLSFEQIAAFCGLHDLEVQALADGEVAPGMQGLDPIARGELTQDEINRCQDDPTGRLEIAKATTPLPKARSKGARYTPVSKRGDRPNAIAWLVRYHPELTDAQVSKLVGTTKQTIAAVRDRTHWNISNITPQDPVTLGLSSQVDLDGAVQKAQDKLEKQQAKAEKELAKKRAANLSAAEASGQPSAQADGVDEDLAATAAEMALVVEPAPESEVAAEPSADNIFGETPEPDAEPEEASPSAEDVFGN